MIWNGTREALRILPEILKMCIPKGLINVAKIIYNISTRTLNVIRGT